MKRRIISSILVVVMLVLSLASCGYSYTKDDLTQYMSIDKDALEAALEKLEYEDGAFTTDPETRAKKIEKYIYDLLAKRIDKDDQKTEGAMSVLDQLYYRYYVTYEKDGKTVYLYASNMNKSNTTTSIQLGNNELEKEKAAIRDAIVALIKEGKLDDIKDYIYAPDNTTSKETTKAGAKAYITYTKTWTEKVDGKDKDYKETHTYELVTLGDETSTSRTNTPSFFDYFC